MSDLDSLLKQCDEQVKSLDFISGTKDFDVEATEKQRSFFIFARSAIPRLAAALRELRGELALETDYGCNVHDDLEKCKAERHQLRQELEEANEHLNTFCKCPTHGPSAVHIPEGEFDD